MAAADALGVPDGPARGRLQAGEEVTVDSGRTVTPAEVLGEARPGLERSCSPATPRRRRWVVEAAHGADLLVHEASFLAEEKGTRPARRFTRQRADAAEVARLAQ